MYFLPPVADGVIFGYFTVLKNLSKQQPKNSNEHFSVVSLQFDKPGAKDNYDYPDMAKEAGA